jgi:hypothetical protein
MHAWEVQNHVSQTGYL